MSITNITPRETKLQAEVAELKAKAEMDYAMIAGDNALIAGLKSEVAELKAKLAEAQKPLADEDILKLADYHTTYQIESPNNAGMIEFARAIEAAHGIKEST